MKKRSLKRLLAGLLSAVLAVTSIPVMEAQAESPLETLGLAAYDYTRMESILQDGKELAYRNNSTGQKKYRIRCLSARWYICSLPCRIMSITM